MRRIALISLTMLSGCGYHTWWNPPFTTGFNPNAPVTISVNMSRAKGRDVAVTPLTTEPGDIWPGPLPPPKTLQDLERQSQTGTQAPAKGSPLDRAGNPLRQQESIRGQKIQHAGAGPRTPAGPQHPRPAAPGSTAREWGARPGARPPTSRSCGPK